MQFPNTTLPVSEYNRFSFRIPVSEYNRAVSESQFPNTTVPVSEYNRRVSEYNRGVSEYNRRVSEYNRPVSEYNRDRSGWGSCGKLWRNMPGAEVAKAPVSDGELRVWTEFCTGAFGLAPVTS